MEKYIVCVFVALLIAGGIWSCLYAQEEGAGAFPSSNAWQNFQFTPIPSPDVSSLPPVILPDLSDNASQQEPQAPSPQAAPVVTEPFTPEGGGGAAQPPSGATSTPTPSPQPSEQWGKSSSPVESPGAPQTLIAPAWGKSSTPVSSPPPAAAWGPSSTPQGLSSTPHGASSTPGSR